MGRRLLRSLYQPNIDAFSLELNIPSILFIASFKNEPLPLEPPKGSWWIAHDTHETLTLLSGVDATGRALEAHRLGIHFISVHTPGEIQFKVSRTAVPFIIFVEPRRGDAFSCGEYSKHTVGITRHFSHCDFFSLCSVSYFIFQPLACMHECWDERV